MLISLSVYGGTMFPGLVGIGDTPKFQFVGSVLGTPHSPGYPLYMLISWAVAHIPAGSLAFRMNAISVVFGAIAAGTFVLVLDELGCAAAVALAGALAIAFGHVFWSQALLAEVYTLNAALFGGVLLFLMRWARTGRERDLLIAVGFTALGAAHHLTLVMTAPALLAYAVVTDRASLRPRTLARAAVIVCAGLSLYGLIWLRTAQHAPYLEVRAASFADLVDVVSARQFGGYLWLFSPQELLFERLPMVAGWLGSELRWPGVCLAALGAVALARRRRRELLLLAGAAAAVVLFAINYDVYDIDVFLILPMIVAGLFAGVGLQQVARLATSRLPASHAARTAVVMGVVVLVPYAQARANFADNNHHRHTFESELFDSLFQNLPQGSAIVGENYPVDHMILYELIGERLAGRRGIELVPPTAEAVIARVAAGHPVYAFQGGRRELEAQGVEFAPADLPLPKPHNVRHIAETETPTIAFPLSRVVVGDSVPIVSAPAPQEDRREMTTSATWRAPS